MVDATPGCGGIIGMMLAALIAFFTGATAFVQTPEVATPQPITIYEFGLAPSRETSAQEFEDSRIALDNRLDILVIYGQIQQYAIEPINGEFAVMVFGPRLDLDTLMKALTAPGRLEFADFGEDRTLQPGQSVLTSGGLAWAGEAANGRTVYPTVIEGAEIASARAEQNTNSGGWQISLTMTADGAAKLGAFTEANTGKVLGIVLDGVILMAPTIQARVADAVVISGMFTQMEAEVLAVQLRSRPYPIALNVTRIGR